MASYRISWKKSAEKELRKLPTETVVRIVRAVDALAENPYPHNSVKLANAEQTFRIRIGDYRVLYTVEDNVLVVQVIRVGHRRDVYRE